MTVQAIRLQNFMGFEDTGWLELRSINLLFGRNSTGKSAILRALLLLRQSLDSRPEDGPLTFVAEDGLDFGGYRQMVRGQRTERKISFWFQCDFSTLEQVADRLKYYLLNLARPDFQEQLTTLNTYRFRLIFSWNKGRAQTMLVGADLYDQNGNLILGGTLLSDDEEQTWVFRSDFFDPNQDNSSIEQNNLQKSTESEINLWPYSRLVIDQGFLPRLDYPNSVFQEPPDDMTYEGNENIPRTTNTCVMFLREIRRSISTFFRTLLYLGPLRAEPERYYYVAGRSGNRPDARGRQVLKQYLAGFRDAESVTRLEQINRWLKAARVGKEFMITSVNKGNTLYAIELVESEANNSLHPNLREVGFGVSQVLPVILQTMLAPRDSLVIIEQPELHLHPKAQADLGDLFIQAAKQSVRFLIETHSEHLLLRLQKQIARTTTGDISEENKAQMLLPNQLSVYFVHRQSNLSSATKIEVGPYGDLLNTPEGFEDFFSDDMVETAERMRARLAGMRKGG